MFLVKVKGLIEVRNSFCDSCIIVVPSAYTDILVVALLVLYAPLDS